ncbi:unique cartilage matrix-associated protein isoform X2 [Dasypus novemcinctus]|uniref:unique cartilage matrix-associated protein isoform X2 n=1 Tax=Dasypus novemcinctus TaxID=9361 RepID=UPI0039C991A3
MTRLLALACLAAALLLPWATQVFMRESEASDFLQKHGKRSPPSRGEASAEKRRRLRAGEQRREYYEEQTDESEDFAEEQNDEQHERSREVTEHWRQWRHDGLDPSYLDNRHHG